MRREDFDREPGEARRFGDQVRPQERGRVGRGIPLVEDQVQHREHDVHPGRELAGRRLFERNPGLADLALRAHETLRRRGLGLEKRPGDLARRQSPERPKGECAPRLLRQRRMTADEQQAQAIVLDRVRLFERHQGRLDVIRQRRVARASEPVDRNPA
jgi:hypothetical protein